MVDSDFRETACSSAADHAMVDSDFCEAGSSCRFATECCRAVLAALDHPRRQHAPLPVDVFVPGVDVHHCAVIVVVGVSAIMMCSKSSIRRHDAQSDHVLPLYYACAIMIHCVKVRPCARGLGGPEPHVDPIDEVGRRPKRRKRRVVHDEDRI